MYNLTTFLHADKLGYEELGRQINKKSYVFLACPSLKHICPTSEADWSPRHCKQM